MADLDKLSIVVEVDDKDSNSKLEALIDKLKEVDSLTQKTNLGQNFENLTAKIQEAETRLEQLEGWIERAVGQLDSFSSSNIDKVADSFSRVSDSAENVSTSFGEVTDVIETMPTNVGEEMASGFSEAATGAEEVARSSDTIEQSFERASSSGSMLGSVLSSIGHITFSGLAFTMRQIEAHGLSAARSMFEFATAPVGILAKGLGSVAKRIDGIRGKIFKMVKMRIYRLIAKQIVGGFSEGLQNAYQWAKIFGNEFASSMDSLATSMLYLKNSIGAMAAPLINRLAPAVEYIVDKFVGFLNIVNQVFATLTGRETWIRAVRVPTAFKEATDDATGSAKKLEKELITILGIDEINPLEGMDDSPTGRGSALAEATDYASMFTQETVALSNQLTDLFTPLKNAWDKKGKGVMDAFNNAWASTNSLINTVKSSFKTVWENGTGQQTLEHLLGIVTGILNTWGNVARAFEKGWKTGDVGTSIVQNLWDILNSILGMWDKIANKTATWAKTLDFAPALKAFNNLLGAIKPVVDIITGALATAWEEVVLPIGKWAIEELVPTALDSLATAFGTLRDIMEDLKPLAKWLLDNILKPAGGIVGEGVILAIEGFGQAWEDLKLLWETMKSLGLALYYLAEGDGKRAIEVLKELGQVYEEANADRGNGLFGMLGDAGEKEGEIEAEKWTGKQPEYLFGDYYWDKETKQYKLVPQKERGDDIQVNAKLNITDVENVPDSVDSKWNVKKQTPLNIPPWLETPWKRSGTDLNGLTNITLPLAREKIGGYGIEMNGMSQLTLPIARQKIGGKGIEMNGMTSLTIPIKRQGIGGKGIEMNGMTALTIPIAREKIGGKGIEMNGMTNLKLPWFLQNTQNVPKNVSIPWYRSSSQNLPGNVSIPWYRSSTQNLPKDVEAPWWISDVIASANTIAGKIRAILGIKGNAKGGAYYGGSWHSIPQYATGGLPSHGSLFMAGESGSELVGHVGGRTEVLNQSQLASTMYSSVASANASQNRLLQEQNNLLRELISKQGGGGFTVSDVIDGFSQMNRRDGRTVVSVGA